MLLTPETIVLVLLLEVPSFCWPEGSSASPPGSVARSCSTSVLVGFGLRLPDGSGRVHGRGKLHHIDVAVLFGDRPLTIETSSLSETWFSLLARFCEIFAIWSLMSICVLSRASKSSPMHGEAVSLLVVPKDVL